MLQVGKKEKNREQNHMFPHTIRSTKTRNTFVLSQPAPYGTYHPKGYELPCAMKWKSLVYVIFQIHSETYEKHNLKRGVQLLVLIAGQVPSPQI